MIVTEHFVYIHQPKTGGTFVTKVLHDLFKHPLRPQVVDRVLTKAGFPCRYLELYKHGTCTDIPEKFSDLPIVASVRNPLDRYVSQWKFQYWRRFPERFPGIETHPSYPDLTFPEFLRLSISAWLRRPFPEVAPPSGEIRIGWHTAEFIRFHCSHPKETFAAACDGSLSPDALRRRVLPSSFLLTHRLNQDLHDLLVDCGVAAAKIKHVPSASRVLPPGGGRSKEDAWKDHYTPELVDFVRHREHLLFDLFPEFDSDAAPRLP